MCYLVKEYSANHVYSLRIHIYSLTLSLKCLLVQQNCLYTPGAIKRATLLCTIASVFHDEFLPTARCYAEHGCEIVCRPSVRDLRYVSSQWLEYIENNLLISRPNSLRLLLGLTPTWSIRCNGNTSKIRVD